MRFLRWTRFAAPVLGLAAVALVIGLPNIALGDEERRDFSATLVSFNETPLTLSTPGHGTVRLRLNQDSISYSLRFDDLSSAPLFAHIHLGERHTTGGVIAFLCGGGGKPLCTPGKTMTGTIAAADIIGPNTQVFPTPFTLAGAERAIRAGAVYANVHSTLFPTGEIRGQLTPNDGHDRDND
jgi:CHRD domain-containing protein